MSTVPSIFGSSNVNSSGQIAPRNTKSTLGQEEFLKLLVTKMTAQDPMNPQGDTDFIAQMAQFSALEQSKTMSADIATLRGQQEMLTANGLIGRTVSLFEGEESLGEGMVTSVKMSDGEPFVVVDGKNYTLDQVGFISPFSSVA